MIDTHRDAPLHGGANPVLEVNEEASFELLRDADYPEDGPFDISKHILGGNARALCGAPTGTFVPLRGEIFYCKDCLQLPAQHFI